MTLPDDKPSAAGLEDAEAVRDEHMPDILRPYSAADLAAMEKSLVRRLDLRTLPILVLLFLLNILDRNAIANARLGGLEETLGLNDQQYQTAVMMVWGETSPRPDPCFSAACSFSQKERVSNF